MNCPPASPAVVSPATEVSRIRVPQIRPLTAALHWLAAAAIPISLLWDFSWESTVGIDLFWAWPHATTYLAVGLAGLIALALLVATTRSPENRSAAVRLGPLYAPLGAWVSAWGALAFLVALLFDRWWQSAYGLSAGIWHPPQILKAVAFLAILIGGWLLGLSCQNNDSPSADEQKRFHAVLFAAGGGLVLTLITVVTLISIYANRQHSAAFYNIACGAYPVVLVATARAGKLRHPATLAATVYTAVNCLMVWLLPLFPASPQVPPVYNQLDHLMPPPFPLLLIAPAIALDLLFRKKFELPSKSNARSWLQAVAAGTVFFAVFILIQWTFAEFLLSDLADNWFFAGGGRHWPFFLKIDSAARVIFWKTAGNEMNLLNCMAAAGLAVLSARVGLWIGEWMTRVRR